MVAAFYCEYFVLNDSMQGSGRATMQTSEDSVLEEIRSIRRIAERIEEAHTRRWKSEDMKHESEFLFMAGVAIFALAYTWYAVKVSDLLVGVMAVLGIVLLMLAEAQRRKYNKLKPPKSG